MRRDGAGESQGCAGTVGGLWGVLNMLVHIGGGPLRISEGWNASVHRQCKILVCLYFREEILLVRYVLVSSSSEDRQRGQEKGQWRWLTQKDPP